MKSYPNPSPLKWLAIIVLGVVLTGCRIEYEAESIVHEDGSIDRTVVYKAQEPSDKQELIDRYELPKDGAWVDTPLNIFSFIKKDPSLVVTAAYRSKRTITAGRTDTDFKRYSVDKDKAATNEFSVNFKDSLLHRDFFYKEKFTDIIDFEKVKSTVNVVWEEGMKLFQAQLAQRFTDTAEVDKMMAEVRDHYSELFKKYYAAITPENVNFKDIHELADKIGDLFSSEATAEILTKKFPELDNPGDRKKISEAFHATETDLNTFLEEDKTGIKKDVEQVFGAHGFTLFHFYDFQIKVKMPGEIIKTNASQNNNGVLLWNFNSEQLNQEITAHSRVFYPKRLTQLCLIIGMLILIILIFLFLRRKPKKRRK